MNKNIIIIILIFTVSSLFGQELYDYIVIPKGCHCSSCDPSPSLETIIMKPVDINWEMEVSFTKSCKYESENKGWNKLYRLEKHFH